MAKDPAFLFYHHDFLVGTAFMSMHDRGIYITLLCYMAAKGPLSNDEVKSIAGPDISTTLANKFKRDDLGNWFNQRLLDEVHKRKAFCESRRLSRTSNVRATYDKHTVNENEDANAVKDIIKTKNTNAAPKPKKQSTFVRDNPPTLEEVTPYCLEHGIDPKQFHDANTAVGWVDKNKTPYRDWKAVVRKWANYRKATAPVVAAAPSKRPVTIVVLEKIAVGMDDRAIMQALVGTYSEHAITEALMHARGKVQ